MNLLGSGSYGCVTNKSIKKKALKLNYISDTDKKSFDLIRYLVYRYKYNKFPNLKIIEEIIIIDDKTTYIVVRQ